MTRDGVLGQIRDALATAPKTSPRALLQALKDAEQFIAAQTEFTAVDSIAIEASPFKAVARQCADELDEAANLKIGVMDSDNRVKAVEGQRLGAMQAVSARLRELT